MHTTVDTQMPPKTKRAQPGDIKCYQLKSTECKQHPDKCVYENYRCKNRARPDSAETESDTGAPASPPAAVLRPAGGVQVKCYQLKSTECKQHPDKCVYENYRCKNRVRPPFAAPETASTPGPHAEAGDDQQVKCYKLKKTQCEKHPEKCVYENNRCKSKPNSVVQSSRPRPGRIQSQASTTEGSVVSSYPSAALSHVSGSGSGSSSVSTASSPSVTSSAGRKSSASTPSRISELHGLFGPASGSVISASSSGSSSTSSAVSTPSVASSGRPNKKLTGSKAGSGSSDGSEFSTASLSPSDSLVHGLFDSPVPAGITTGAQAENMPARSNVPQVVVPVRDDAPMDAASFNAYCTAIAMDRMSDRKAELQTYMDDDLTPEDIANLKGLRDWCLRYNGGNKRFSFKFQDAHRAIAKFESAPQALSVPYAFDAVSVRKAMSAYWSKCLSEDRFTPKIKEKENMYEAFKSLAEKGRFEELFVVAHLFARPMRSFYAYLIGEVPADADKDWIPGRNSFTNPHSGPMFVERMVKDVFSLPNMTLEMERWPERNLGFKPPSWYTQAVAGFMGKHLMPKLSTWKQASVIRAVLTMHKERPALQDAVLNLQYTYDWLDIWAFVNRTRVNVQTAHRAGSLSWAGWVSALWAVALIFMYELEKNIVRGDKDREALRLDKSEARRKSGASRHFQPLPLPEPVRNLQAILDTRPYDIDAVLLELNGARNKSIQEALSVLRKVRPPQEHN